MKQTSVRQRLSLAERRPALELFNENDGKSWIKTSRRAPPGFNENGGSWVKAVKLCNDETGYSFTRSALLQSVERLDTLGDQREPCRTKRPWADLEVQALAAFKHTKHGHYPTTYKSFITTMQAHDANYVPRTYQEFVSQLVAVRQRGVKRSRPNVPLVVPWNDNQFEQFMINRGGSKSTVIEAAMLKVNQRRNFLRDLYHQVTSQPPPVDSGDTTEEETERS